MFGSAIVVVQLVWYGFLGWFSGWFSVVFCVNGGGSWSFAGFCSGDSMFFFFFNFFIWVVGCG